MEEAPGFDGIYKVGTVVEVKQLNKLPDNIVRVMVEAKKRGRIYSLYENGKRLDGEIEIMPCLQVHVSQLERDDFRLKGCS